MVLFLAGAAMSTEDVIELRLEATSAAVPVARRAVGSFAEDHGVDRPGVELAVTEAVANAVVHAFPDGVPGEVLVRAWVPGRQLKVEVSDDGVGMGSGSGRPGLGMGLRLIESLTREFSLGRSQAGGTLVSMRFELLR